MGVVGAGSVRVGLFPCLSGADRRIREHYETNDLDVLNEAIMHGVNATGKALLSHTRLNDKLALRLSIGNIRTTEKHVRAGLGTSQSRASEVEVRRRGQGLMLRQEGGLAPAL